jgi:hypothetical protein
VGVALGVQERATAVGVFSAQASASGMLASAESPELPGLIAVGGSAPTAQAAVTSSGDSQAFASLPYPGEAVATAPGLLRSMGAPQQTPDYPGYVASDYPSRPKQQFPAAGDPAGAGYRLSAESSETKSAAAASSGLEAEGGVATGLATANASSEQAANGTVRARGEARVESFGAAGVLRVGQVLTSATVMRDLTGKLVRSTSTEIENVSVAGQAVGVRDGALVVGTAETPLGDSALGAILASAGISMEVVAAEPTTDGVVAGGLLVVVRTPESAGEASAMRYRIGFASASVALEVLGDRTGGTGGSGAAGNGSGTGAAVDSTSGGGTTSGSAPASGSAGAADLSPSTLPSGSVPEQPPAPALATSGQGGAALELDFLPIYVALALAALTVLGSGHLIRLLGVRLRWIS